MEYRKSEGVALKNFAAVIGTLTAPSGDQSAAARLEQTRNSISEKYQQVERVDKNPRSGPITDKFDHVPQPGRPWEVCTRVVVWERVWTITGNVKDGWSDTDQLITHSDQYQNCVDIDAPRPSPGGPGGPGGPDDPRHRWLEAGAQPEAGEFDDVSFAEYEQTHERFELYRLAASGPSLTASGPSNLLASTHSNTELLNELSTQIRDLENQAAILEEIVKALTAILDAIAARQRDLPRL